MLPTPSINVLESVIPPAPEKPISETGSLVTLSSSGESANYRFPEHEDGFLIDSMFELGIAVEIFGLPGMGPVVSSHRLRAIVDRSATDNLAAKRTPHHLSATEKVPMTTSDKILISDCIAIFLTPVAALWIGGILQRRSDGYLTSAGGPGAASIPSTMPPRT
jgi:hypothetical protein